MTAWNPATTPDSEENSVFVIVLALKPAGGVATQGARTLPTSERSGGGLAVQLPISMRESLVEEVDEYLEAFSSEPDPEAVGGYVVELLENYADDEGIDDLIAGLEEQGELDGTLQDTLETEMSSNDEFEYTGEEIISLLERLCGIEWEADEEEEEDDEGDEESEEAEQTVEEEA